MEKYEQSISLKDLFYVVLRGWRKIIALALIGLILFGAYGIYNNRKGALPKEPEPVVLTDKEMEAFEKELNSSNAKYVASLQKTESIQADILALEKRLEASDYLNVNWRAPARAGLSIKVTPEAPSLLAEDTLEQRAYLMSLDFLRASKSQPYYDYLGKAAGDLLHKEWIYELITSSRGEDNVVSLEIVAPDQETLGLLTDATRRYFSYEIRETLAVPYLYEIGIQEDKILSEIDPDFLHLRKDLEDELCELQTAVILEEQHRDAIRERALERAIAEKENEMELNDVAPKKQSLVKLAVIGAVLGVMGAILLIAAKASFADEVRDPETFANKLGVLYIGGVGIRSEAGGRKLFGFIDEKIDSLFYGQDKKHQVSYIASIIRGLAGDSQRLAILDEEHSPVAQELVEALNRSQADGSLVGILSNLDEEEGVLALQSADAAVLLIHTRKTKLSDALRDVEITMGMKKPILGVVSQEYLPKPSKRDIIAKVNA